MLQAVLQSVSVVLLAGSSLCSLAGFSGGQGLLSPREPCRPAELGLVQPSLELLVWQLCPWQVYHRIVLKLFDFFVALLWELGVFGVFLWLVLPAPSWCCWSLCHGAVTSQASAGVTAELLEHLSPSPPHLVAGELRLWCLVKYRPWSRASAWDVCSQQLADKACPVLQAHRGAERSCLPLGVWRWDSARAPQHGSRALSLQGHVGFIAGNGGNVQLQVQK